MVKNASPGQVLQYVGKGFYGFNPEKHTTCVFIVMADLFNAYVKFSGINHNILVRMDELKRIKNEK